jgi:hypothetical protein
MQKSSKKCEIKRGAIRNAQQKANPILVPAVRNKDLPLKTVFIVREP